MTKPVATTADTFAKVIPRLAPAVECVRTAEGLIRLCGPLKRGGWWRRCFGLPRRAHVELDDIGTFVVERLGESTVATLAQQLAEHLRLHAREAEVALGDFLRLLLQRRLIELVPPRSP